ncbi:disease resistance protein RPM1-like [Vigna unguiculata]|uniref:disease resistance protein RPM1-like n=1 Tax=Vigna unguiculata TaxID=3917 RepID=UPI0010162C86|nr:disease resistance protein RPM1-like [Vigna unguiculata]
MAETAVSFASQHVLPKLLETVKMLRDLPKEVEEVTDELKSFEVYINIDANRVAEAEKDRDTSERIRKRLMRLREAAFRMENVIDDYVMICDANQPEEGPRCAALLCEAVEFIKTQIHRLQIAYQIQDVKSLVRVERDGFKKDFPTEPISNGSSGNENFTWHKLRMDPLFFKQDEVVGFEGPIQTLKKWLTEGRKERTVISIVGMAGLGKTTLGKQVFDTVDKHFECHAVVTVSRPYDVLRFLRELTKKLYRESKEEPPRDVATMDRMSLIEEIRNRLCNKRYVVFFDDVWEEKFWDDIESALIDNKNGSRILITTRVEKVVDFCKKCLFFEVHKIKPLSKEKSLELLWRKAFGYDFDERCTKDYKEVGLDIVRKCECLPLAIVAIGSLLSTKPKSPSEWGRFSKNLESNPELDSVKKILSLSYDDLPQNLRSCLLYFGMYPEDCTVKSGRLIQQWIAEGFIRYENGKTLKEVAEKYLMELINRSLVQVSSFSTGDRAKECRVHDSIHEMIREKMKNTGFCEHSDDEHNQSESSGIIRRLTIAKSSYDLSGPSEGSQYVRSILILTKEVLSEQFSRALLAKYTRLKVLDFGYARLTEIPENLGSLIHLKYLSFQSTSISSLPKSIGNLQNLETLDIRTGMRIELPKEITKLRKLRCLLGKPLSSISVKDSLGSITSLEKMHVLLIDPDGVVVRELAKLTKLSDLRVSDVKGDHANTLCASINEMPLLERLHISLNYGAREIDLHISSSLSELKKLHLCANLKEFPNWILSLENLLKLSLVDSRLTNIPLISLGNMPNLLILSFGPRSFEGETLHFQNGGFRKLKELKLKRLYQLSSIFIDSGALQSLEKLEIFSIPQLKTVPSGIQHLEKLQVLDILRMPTEFQQSIDPNGGEDHWMIKHVPHLHFVTKNRGLLKIQELANILASQRKMKQIM